MAEVKTGSGQTLVVFPRYEDERTQTSSVISEVLAECPTTYEEGDFMFQGINHA